MKIHCIEISNFKGISRLKIDACGKNVAIDGSNGTGKTSILDSISWCLFGQDSSGRSDFSIKPKDGLSHGSVVSVSVEYVSEAGAVHSFKRELSEVYERKRGEAESVFTGNTTTYYINGLATPMKSFNEAVFAFIPSYFVDVLAFNKDTSKWGWKDRRKVLFSLGEMPSDYEIANDNSGRWERVKDMLLLGKTLSTVSDESSASVRNIKKRLDETTTRVDEVIRSISNVEINTVALTSEKAVLLSRLAAIDTQGISTQAKAIADKITGIEVELKILQNKKSAINNDLFCESQRLKKLCDGGELDKAIVLKTDEQSKLLNLIDATAALLDCESQNLENARQEVRDVMGSTFNPETVNNVDCHVCGQPLPPEIALTFLQKLSNDFEKEKQAKVDTMVVHGKMLAKTVEDLMARLNSLNDRKPIVASEIAMILKNIEENRKRYDEVVAKMNDTNIHNDIDTYIASLEKQLEQYKAEASKHVATESNEAIKSETIRRIGEIDTSLAISATNDEKRNRVEELKAEGKKLGASLANAERDCDEIKEFTIHKCNIASDVINSKFNLVRFNLFDTLTNGNVVEICECAVDGVPYTSINSAAKINAGIDILNALFVLHGETYPIFVDNIESVNSLIDTEAQVFSFRVTESPFKVDIK